MRLALTLLLSMMIAGCTTPVQVDEGKKIPEKRIYNSEYLSPQDGYEKVTFTRDKGILGSAGTFELYIDNKKAFGLRQGNVVTTYLKPGNHTFDLKAGDHFYRANGQVAAILTTLVKGEPQEFRVSISASGTDFSRTK